MLFKILFLLLLSLSLYGSEIVWSGTSSSDVSDAEYQQALKEHVAKNYPKELAAWEEQVKKEKEKEETFRTGALMWQDDAEAKTVLKNWHNAQAYCNDLQFGDFYDWRLPTKSELESLYKEKSNLKNVSSIYWSSTTYEDNKGTAWIVGFYRGGVGNGNKGNSYYVRCVRAGE